MGGGTPPRGLVGAIAKPFFALSTKNVDKLLDKICLPVRSKMLGGRSKNRHESFWSGNEGREKIPFVLPLPWDDFWDTAGIGFETKIARSRRVFSECALIRCDATALCCWRNPTFEKPVCCRWCLQLCVVCPKAGGNTHAAVCGYTA